MFRILSILALLSLAFQARAIDRITASVVVTNAPTTNGMTFTVTTTSGTTRTFTNSVYNSTSQVLTNLTGAGSATNLANNLIATPPAGAVVLLTGASNITIYGNAGVPLTVTAVPAGYFSVSYATQSVNAAYTVRVPNTVEAAAMRTNIGTGLVDWLNLTGNTNQLAQSQPAMAQLTGLTNAQTLSGVKFITNSAGLWQGYVSNSLGISGNLGNMTNGLLRSPIAIDLTVTNAIIVGNITATNVVGVSNSQSVFGAKTFTSGSGIWYGYVSNSAGISGNVNFMTNGLYRAPVLNDATLTNGTFYGTHTMYGTLDVQGSLGFVGYASYITADSDKFSMQPESASLVTIGNNGLIDGVAANAAYFTNNVRASTLTITNITAYGGAKLASTNTFPAGSDIAFGRYALTSLANGANSIIVGTNVFVEVSGPTAVFSIDGINGSPNRDGKVVEIVSQVGFNMTIVHQSGTEPTAANRIISLTGADRTSTTACYARLIYSGAASRWILVAFDP
jgi:hypothetical protein